MKTYPTQTIKVNGDTRALIAVFLLTPPPESEDEDVEPVSVGTTVLNAGKTALEGVAAKVSACSTTFFLDPRITGGTIQINVNETENEPESGEE